MHEQRAVLALLSFAMLIVSLDQYIIVVALPDIASDLGYTPQTLQSVVSAYAIASSGFLLFGGRASDVLGRRRVLVVGLSLYCLASLAGGLVSTASYQLAARAFQGLGGALVFPSTLAIINVRFAEGIAADNTVVPADRVPFAFEAPGQPQQLGPLWGTRSAGPAGTLLKFPGGVEAPAHAHTADYRAVVIKGTWKHWVQGAVEGRGPDLNAGAYWTQKADQMHADACVSGTDCVILIINEDPYETYLED